MSSRMRWRSSRLMFCALSLPSFLFADWSAAPPVASESISARRRPFMAAGMLRGLAFEGVSPLPKFVTMYCPMPELKTRILVVDDDQRLRDQNSAPAIIMLTAKGDDVDRIVGLEMGADDYLPKPFNPRELLARINAVLRRRTPPGPPGAPASGTETHRFGRFRAQPRHAHPDARGQGAASHHRRILGAQGPGAAPARAAVARQADGARPGPRVRGVRPLDRRADLAAEENRRGRSVASEAYPDGVGLRLRFRPGQRN